jgi:hypothetical protein
MDRKRQGGEEGSAGRILAEDFDVDTDFGVRAGQLADRLGRAAVGRREAANDVENAHAQGVKTASV